ncbi:ATP-dependent DNA ligase [Streptomyces rochei]|uniref:ATP-dependent DNA ligase n=1 Tax=Streptomyces rochei TaxID=1928 RepID=UPI0036331EDD
MEVTRVDPQLVVVEVDVDVARDGAGRWRHTVQLYRVRPDLPSKTVAHSGA